MSPTLTEFEPVETSEIRLRWGRFLFERMNNKNRLKMKRGVGKQGLLLLCALLLLRIGGSCTVSDQKRFTPGEVWQDTQGVAINAHGGGILLEGDTY